MRLLKSMGTLSPETWQNVASTKNLQGGGADFTFQQLSTRLSNNENEKVNNNKNIMSPVQMSRRSRKKSSRGKAIEDSGARKVNKQSSMVDLNLINIGTNGSDDKKIRKVHSRYLEFQKREKSGGKGNGVLSTARACESESKGYLSQDSSSLSKNEKQK